METRRRACTWSDIIFIRKTDMGQIKNYFSEFGLTGLINKGIKDIQYKHRAAYYLKENALTAEEIKLQQETEYKESVLISIAVPVYNTPEQYLREMIESVLEQTYSNWELCIADGSDGDHGYVQNIIKSYAELDSRIKYINLNSNKGIVGNTQAAIKMAEGQYIGLLDHDDALAPNALYECRRAINRGADVIYSNEVTVDDSLSKPRIIHFKPDFSPVNLLSQNYICHFLVFRTELYKKFSLRTGYEGSQDYDLVLRLTDNAARVVHIPKVLYYWRRYKDSAASGASAKPYAVEAGRKAVQSFLDSLECDSVVSAYNDLTLYHVDIYTDDEVAPVTKPNNHNMEAAFEKADFAYICEKNIIPYDEDTIRQLLMYAKLENVAAVGGILINRNRILGGAYRMDAEDFLTPVYKGRVRGYGYMRRLITPQNVTALANTGLIINKDVFNELKGFDERLRDKERLADFCMRAWQAGYDVVFNPLAKFRLKGKMKKDRKISTAFKAKWKDTVIRDDPYFNEDTIWYQ